jgi:hypothetical protein
VSNYQCQLGKFNVETTVPPVLATGLTIYKNDGDSSKFCQRNTPGAPHLVTLDFPVPLQQRVINALKADPKTVDLRAQAPHFYALGARIMERFEDRAVLDALLDVSRLFSIIRYCPLSH